jgi:hypothetical protein
VPSGKGYGTMHKRKIRNLRKKSEKESMTLNETLVGLDDMEK